MELNKISNNSASYEPSYWRRLNAEQKCQASSNQQPIQHKMMKTITFLNSLNDISSSRVENNVSNIVMKTFNSSHSCHLFLYHSVIGSLSCFSLSLLFSVRWNLTRSCSFRLESGKGQRLTNRDNRFTLFIEVVQKIYLLMFMPFMKLPWLV